MTVRNARCNDKDNLYLFMEHVFMLHTLYSTVLSKSLLVAFIIITNYYNSFAISFFVTCSFLRLFVLVFTSRKSELVSYKSLFVLVFIYLFIYILFQVLWLPYSTHFN